MNAKAMASNGSDFAGPFGVVEKPNGDRLHHRRRRPATTRARSRTRSPRRRAKSAGLDKGNVEREVPDAHGDVAVQGRVVHRPGQRRRLEGLGPRLRGRDDRHRRRGDAVQRASTPGRSWPRRRTRRRRSCRRGSRWTRSSTRSRSRRGSSTPRRPPRRSTCARSTARTASSCSRSRRGRRRSRCPTRGPPSTRRQGGQDLRAGLRPQAGQGRLDPQHGAGQRDRRGLRGVAVVLDRRATRWAARSTSNGKVKIGDKAGTITVRAGDKTSYDEVKITITAAPAAKPTAAGGRGLRRRRRAAGRRARQLLISGLAARRRRRAPGTASMITNDAGDAGEAAARPPRRPPWSASGDPGLEVAEPRAARHHEHEDRRHPPAHVLGRRRSG